MAGLETLVDRPPWRIDHVPGRGSDLVVSFASIGHDATRPPSPEFLRHATVGGRPALFVSDAARSWATAPGLADALGQALDWLRGRQQIARILGIGSSLGGFTALRAAEFAPLDAVLAISPQHRPAAPDEARWRDWTHRLPPELTAPLPARPWVILAHGLADDAAQALAFPWRRAVDHLLFAGQTHAGLARHLKTQGGLQGLIDSALAGDRRRLLRIAAGAGGHRRTGDLPGPPPPAALCTPALCIPGINPPDGQLPR